MSSDEQSLLPTSLQIPFLRLRRVLVGLAGWWGWWGWTTRVTGLSLSSSSRGPSWRQQECSKGRSCCWHLGMLSVVGRRRHQQVESAVLGGQSSWIWLDISTLETLPPSSGRELAVRQMIRVGWWKVHRLSQMRRMQLVTAVGACYRRRSSQNCCDLRPEVHVGHPGPGRQDDARLEKLECVAFPSQSLPAVDLMPVGLACFHRPMQVGDGVVVVAQSIDQASAQLARCCSRFVGRHLLLSQGVRRHIPQVVVVDDLLSLRRIGMRKMDWSVTRSCGRRRWHGRRTVDR